MARIKPDYCVLVKDQADSRFYKVKSKHRTRHSAEKSIPSRLRRSRRNMITTCHPRTKLGDKIPVD